MASPPSSSGLEEPWQPCRGQPHGAPLTWTFQPAILAERGPSAPSGMRPPAAAYALRLAALQLALSVELPHIENWTRERPPLPGTERGAPESLLRDWENFFADELLELAGEVDKSHLLTVLYQRQNTRR